MFFFLQKDLDRIETNMKLLCFNLILIKNNLKIIIISTDKF